MKPRHWRYCVGAFRNFAQFGAARYKTRILKSLDLQRLAAQGCAYEAAPKELGQVASFQDDLIVGRQERRGSVFQFQGFSALNILKRASFITPAKTAFSDTAISA